MKPLNTAVVGLGRIGWQFHLPHIAAHKGFNLVAVVDPLAERRDEAFRKYGVRGHADIETLFAGESFDLIVLASPTHLHADQAIAAMSRGIDVFCDKPMALNVAEVDRMIAVMRETGRKLMVYQPHRVTAEVQAVRHILDSGMLGDVFMIKRSVVRYIRRNDWQALKRYGGGMLNNYGAHFIDQLLYLTGSHPARITCVLQAVATRGDADDVVKALIEMDNGVVLDVEINMATAQPVPKWVLLGRYGTAVMNEGQTFMVKRYDPAALPDLALDNGLAAAGRTYNSQEEIPWQTQTISVSDFSGLNFYDLCYAYYAQDQAPFVPVTQTRETMLTLAECRHSAGWD